MILLTVFISGCFSPQSDSSTSGTSATTPSTTPTTETSGKGSTLVFTVYTSSQFGQQLPAFKVTAPTNPDIKYFQYAVGNDYSYSSLIPIGRTVAIDPSAFALSFDGLQKIFLRGVEANKTTNEASRFFWTPVNLFPLVADGHYVGDRSITYADKTQEMRRVAYSGVRSSDSISSGVLQLFEPDDFTFSNPPPPASRILNVIREAPVFASPPSVKVAPLEFLFGQSADNDYLRAVGGFGNDSAGGYYDRLILNYTASDPFLGTIWTSDMRLYRVKQDINSSIGFLNAAGTLKNVDPAALDRVTAYPFYLVLQTFDNFKYVGHLRLLDPLSMKIYTYPAVGRAGSLDDPSRGILFSSTDNLGKFSGYLEFDGLVKSGSSLKISQMIIRSGNIKANSAEVPLGDYHLDDPYNEVPSISLLQPFNPWP